MSKGGTQRYKHQFPPAFSRLYEDRDLAWVVPLHVDYIIGVLGQRFAGKSAALNYLSEKRGFKVYSLASIVRARADDVGMLPTRPNLQDLGDDIRFEAADAGRLARLELRQIRLDQLERRLSAPPIRIAVGGFKHPAELEAFQRLGRFRPMRILAPERVRYRRAKRTGMLGRELAEISPGLKVSPGGFRRWIDRRDRKGTADRPWAAEYEQAVDEVLLRAKDSIDIQNVPQPAHKDSNDSGDVESLSVLYAQLDVAIDELEQEFGPRTTTAHASG
jgi:hypothetical protein